MDNRRASEPTAINAQPKPERLLRLAGVEHLSGLKKSSIYKLMKEGKFPVCVRVTARVSAWPESKVLAWVHERIASGGQA